MHHPQHHPRVAAVIVAAGNSTRMGVPKQFLTLGDRPVIAHTLAAFEACECIDEIVLVAREADTVTLRQIVTDYGIHKVKAIVPGGNTRQQSVANGIAACGEDTEYFAIHDGARPLIKPERITAVVTAALQDGAAALAVRVKDTVKVADENGWVVSTPTRAQLWNVQTPQVFERQLYLCAVQYAEENGLAVTDDCQLVEALHRPVRLVEGDYTNLKITTPEDVRCAEGWLE